MRVILVRHYKTLINASGSIMGWGDAPRVKEWEEDLAAVYRGMETQGLEIDAVYSSFLERARQTAMYYAGKTGIRLVHDSPQLNEINYGQLFRKPKQWVAEHVPQYKTDPDFVFPGGESFRQMQRRSVDFVLSLEARHARHTLLLVVHAGVIRGLVCHFLGLDYAPNLKHKISHRYIGEMVIEGGRCIGYDEFGALSGFVTSGVIRLPRSHPIGSEPPLGGARDVLGT